MLNCTIPSHVVEHFIVSNNISAVSLIMGWSIKWSENTDSTLQFLYELSIPQFFAFRHLPDHVLIQSWGSFPIVLNECEIRRAVGQFLNHFFYGLVLVLQERLQHDLKRRNVNTWLVWNRGKNVFIIYCYSPKILPSQQLRTWYNVHKTQEKTM